jgi:putative endonuclease
MAYVYILHSVTADKFYVGSTKDQTKRLEYHLNKEFENSFTAKYSDWELFFSIETADNTIARKVEAHIKKMKSSTYILNLKKYPEIAEKLILKYSPNS